MALSVLDLGIQHKMESINKSDLLRYAEFLIHGPWMLEHLQQIARQKVASLRFVDEIEVYLGYPVKLRERLNLQIDVEDMLYFRCSGITEEDLDRAASFIEDQIKTSDAIAGILIQRQDWIEALALKHSSEMSAIKEQRTNRYESLEQFSQAGSQQDLQSIQAEYENSLKQLTQQVLDS